MIGKDIRNLHIGLVLFLALWTCSESTVRADNFLIVVGAGGTSDYQDVFQSWAEKWTAALSDDKHQVALIGEELPDSLKQSTFEGATDRERLLSAIQTFGAPGEDDRQDLPVWIVYFGHGTFGGSVANLNLVGPDISAKALAEAMQAIQRPVVFVDTSACSGPFIESLTGANRVIVTATRSGDELNFARFGGFLADSFTEPGADLDHDDCISLLEAFLHASSATADFYEMEDRLQTEHSLLEDNGDGKGTSREFFRGVRVVQASQEGQEPDGELARTLILSELAPRPELSLEDQKKLSALDKELTELRNMKSGLPLDEYYREVERICTAIATIEQLPEPEGDEAQATPEAIEQDAASEADASQSDAGE